MTYTPTPLHNPMYSSTKFLGNQTYASTGPQLTSATYPITPVLEEQTFYDPLSRNYIKSLKPKGGYESAAPVSGLMNSHMFQIPYNHAPTLIQQAPPPVH